MLLRDVTNNDALVSEITKKNSVKCEQMQQQNIILQVYDYCCNFVMIMF